MSITHGYLTLNEFRDVQRDAMTAYDAEYERAIEAASRQIDDYCGRIFYAETVATAKTFRPDQLDEVWVPDISSTSGLLVKTDDDDDGVFETTWTLGTDFQMEPLERLNGTRPYERIVALGSAVFPTPNLARYFTTSHVSIRPSRRARVQITAKWGWPTTPTQVKQACSILATDHFQAKDMTNISSQYGTGTRFLRDTTGGHFGRGERFVRIQAPLFNPVAEALLQPLRVVVVA